METMHTLLNTWHRNEPGKPNPSTYQAPTCRNGCFYCWALGHYITNCEFLATDITEGKVEMQEDGGRVDMRKLPKEPPYLSPKDRVDRAWRNRKQFTVEEFPEDPIITLASTGLVMIQSNQHVPNKKDKVISDLQERARHADEECDMWKAMSATRQLNMSVPTTSQVPQNAPQAAALPAQPAQMTMDPRSMELMSMFARMMNLSATDQEGVEKGFTRAQ